MPASNGLAAPRRAPATKRSRPIATPRGKPSRANWSSTSPAAGRHPATANHRLRWRRRNRAPHLRTTSSPHGRRASQRAAIIAGTEISGVTARPLAGTTSHTAPTHAARLYPESPSPEPTDADVLDRYHAVVAVTAFVLQVYGHHQDLHSVPTRRAAAPVSYLLVSIRA